MPRDARRPSGLRLWLRRRRGLIRPAIKVTLGLLLVGFILSGVAAFDPAGRLAVLTGNVGDSVAATARGAGLVVGDIQVEGARNTPPAMLRTALGVRRGDPTLAFSPAEARERLEALPWIESAHVERRLPGTVLVRVTERRPFAIWQNNGRFSVVDREGRVVATDRLDAFGPLPLIVGAGAERHAGALMDLLEAAPEVLARTKAMMRVGERRWNLVLFSGTDVMLPEGHEAPAIRRLAELQRAQSLLDRPLAAVDLRLPDRLVLRPQPTAATTPATAPEPRRSSGRG